MTVEEIIRKDLYRYAGQDSILKGLRIPGFRYSFLLRKASKFPERSSLKGIIYRRLLKFASHYYGFQIPPETKIGEGLYIGHFGTVIINNMTSIGKNCNLSPNVTIGQANRGSKKGAPIIGDKVWIGTGAVIVGKIKIGSNVLIAPNSFVNMDVPNDSLVIGNPAKIIKKLNPTEGYSNFLI
ncbi:serine O-acetyltransferase [Salegentibacter holothuriorum]|uniref:Serine acetyltransferase n=1 Tax=Salegentibacter holothuriorum TaxID=241145 RepID=A0A1T5APB9_9FLAO|nr:serine acetyltransferase [Salegentibacter holothuriorum]SKB36874.1 serine O-acetyltransferase [Salegentibacter holothuriorum]